ncbi:arsenical resistance protein ArsH [Parvularcula oceani]|uniref:arsenical resistance protein ArsH n=1 Tax=Parvularcula oceani TaxID=1247963 RepID=UPI0009DD0907|nr:arsenical resistance protein ArsH [Parvularcula oceani]
MSKADSTPKGVTDIRLSTAAEQHLRDAELPNLVPGALQPIDPDDFARPGDPRHPPRILLLYGSLRERSYSRLLSEEAARLLQHLGCDTRTFSPDGLPLPDAAFEDGEPADHPKVAELRDFATWSEGMMWVSPERHGAMTGIMKAQIDWLPLSLGGVRPTQGKTLALAQVSGGSQSFNTLNQMRVLGRWMRMVTIPNQSSVPKAFAEFDEAGRMKPSPFYMRLVDVCEELVRFTWMVRGRSALLTDRYSERVESAEETSARVNHLSI